MSKLHLVDAGALVRSVLMQKEATAACGETKVHTRKDIDAASDSSKKVCVACLKATGEKVRTQEVILSTPLGWTALLERVFLAEEAERTRPTWNVQWTSGQPVTWGFPPAA